MSYAEFCQDQASDCARRARLARSAHIAAYYHDLGWRWLRLAEQAQQTGGALGSAVHASLVEREARALSPPRLQNEPALAKAQVARAHGSSFRLRFREKVDLPRFKRIAKDPARLFNSWMRGCGPWRTRLASSLRSTAALRK
jgi:hypothetical protein